MDLIRELLLELEAAEPPKGWYEITIDGRSEVEISYHLMLMKEAGLVEALDLSSSEGLCCKAKRLTYEGHEFLDAARDNNFWEKAKKKAMTATGTVTMEGLKIAIGVLIKSAITGLPPGTA